MKKNMGTLDKSIRSLAALVIAIFYFTGVFTGTAAFVFLIIAIVFALTSLVNFCPLYTLIGVNTCKIDK